MDRSIDKESGIEKEAKVQRGWQMNCSAVQSMYAINHKHQTGPLLSCNFSNTSSWHAANPFYHFPPCFNQIPIHLHTHKNTHTQCLLHPSNTQPRSIVFLQSYSSLEPKGLTLADVMNQPTYTVLLSRTVRNAFLPDCMGITELQIWQ